jgi:hypothetical protein
VTAALLAAGDGQGSGIAPVTGIALVAVAFVVDWSAAGPNAVRDRVAGLLGICGLYALYDGTATASAVQDGAVSVVQSLTSALGGRWSQASAGALLTLFAGLAAAAVAAAFLPDSEGQGGRPMMSGGSGWQAAATRVSLRPKKARRINVRIWVAAAAMAFFGPLAQGLLGDWIGGAFLIVPTFVSGFIAALFGLPA